MKARACKFLGHFKRHIKSDQFYGVHTYRCRCCGEVIIEKDGE